MAGLAPSGKSLFAREKGLWGFAYEYSYRYQYSKALPYRTVPVCIVD